MNGPVNCIDFHSKRMQWHYIDRGIFYDVDGSCNRGMRHGNFRYFANGNVVATVKFSKDNEVKTSCSVPGAEARSPLNICLSQLYSGTEYASAANSVSPWTISPAAQSQEQTVMKPAQAEKTWPTSQNAVLEISTKPVPFPVKKNTDVDKHSGFYLDGTIAFQYDNYTYSYDRYYLSRDYSGIGAGFELRIGGNILNLAAPYFFLGYSIVSGDEKLKNEENSATSGTITNMRGRRLGFGLGTTFFPFRNRNSVMNGFFISPEFGVSIFWLRDSDGHTDNYLIHATEDDEKYGFDYYDNYSFDWDYSLEDVGVHLQLEMGKVWAINDRWNVGFGIAAAFDGENSEENEYDCDMNFCSEEFYSFSFRVGLKVIRK